MKFLQILLKFTDTLFRIFITTALFVTGCYSLFALWDNQRIYSAAKNIQADMLLLKPQSDPTTERTDADFSQLQQINPDVCAWLTLENTQIQYPVVQGETNLSYINQDVYGNFALAGSIYLDSRNNRFFTDTYCLLYGHHMENHRMFGDLDLYLNETFFETNHTGTLLTPQQNYSLEIIACLVVNASDEKIFSPTHWQPQNQQELLAYIAEHALHTDTTLFRTLTNTESPLQLLALSTCSAVFTDARTIVIAAMFPN